MYDEIIFLYVLKIRKIKGFYKVDEIGKGVDRLAVVNAHLEKIENEKNFIFKYFFLLLLIIIIILISVAFLTYLERKKLSIIQNRKGPNKVGYFGMLQPFADGIKLFLKELIIPQNSILVIFFLSSLYAFFFGLFFFAIIPFYFSFVISDINYGFFFFFIISVLHVYSIILAG
jgi:NADH:ubiquinone oxidoreductase subunit H